MKYLTVLLITLVSFIGCDDSSDDPPPDPVEYTDPCEAWELTGNGVTCPETIAPVTEECGGYYFCGVGALSELTMSDPTKATTCTLTYTVDALEQRTAYKTTDFSTWEAIVPDMLTNVFQCMGSTGDYVLYDGGANLTGNSLYNNINFYKYNVVTGIGQHLWAFYNNQTRYTFLGTFVRVGTYLRLVGGYETAGNSFVRNNTNKFMNSLAWYTTTLDEDNRIFSHWTCGGFTWDDGTNSYLFGVDTDFDVYTDTKLYIMSQNQSTGDLNMTPVTQTNPLPPLFRASVYKHGDKWYCSGGWNANTYTVNDKIFISSDMSSWSELTQVETVLDWKGMFFTYDGTNFIKGCGYQVNGDLSLSFNQSIYKDYEKEK